MPYFPLWALDVALEPDRSATALPALLVFAAAIAAGYLIARARRKK